MTMTATVTFIVDVPAIATEQQVEDWIKYEIGERSYLPGGNPLCMFALKAEKVISIEIKN